MLDETTLLEGVLVADLTVAGPGPYCTGLLARLGARVIQFEPPGGDPSRRVPGLYERLGAGKESVVVDLQNPADRTLVLGAARRAQVFVEGWRPGVAARLGLGPEAVQGVNPAIVYCSISGYGQQGDLRDRAGHDLNYVAESGLLAAMFGDVRPTVPRIVLADMAGGMLAALRILASLAGARATGRGARIDTSIAGAVRDWVEVCGAAAWQGSLMDLLPAYGIFETADGELLTLGVVFEDHFWRDLCGAIGLDRADLSVTERSSRVRELREEIAAIIRSKPRSHWEAVLAGVDTCWAFVRPPAQKTAVRGMLPPCSRPAPALGEHTERVRAEFAPTVAPPARP